MQAFIITFASVIVGGGLAGATVVGLVNTQTAPPSDPRPASSNPVLEYGATE